jgi:hypothetical protein
MMIGVCSLIISPKSFLSVFYDIISASNFFAAKICLGFAIVRFRANIFRVLQYFYRKSSSHEIQESKIEGIPKNELLHFMLKTEGFKLADCKRILGIGLGPYNRIAKKLEKIGVLMRGENNSRILNPEFSVNQIKDILDGATSAQELSGFRVVRNNKQVNIQTPEEIDKELANAFTIREIRKA